MGSTLDLVIAFVVGGILFFVAEWLWDNHRRKRDHRAYQQDTAELYAALERANGAKSAAQKESNAVLARADGLQAQKERLEKELLEMRPRLNKASDELEASKVQLRQMTAIEQANETLRQKLESTETQLRDSVIQSETLRSKVGSTSTQFGAISKRADNLQKALDSAEGQVVTLRQEKQTLRDRLAQAEEELATLSAQRVVSRDQSAEIEKLRAERDQASSEVGRLRSGITSAQSHIEKAIALQEENASLKARLDSAESELLQEHRRAQAAETKLQNMADQLTDERLRARQVERTASAASKTQFDSLPKIHGIGKVFAERLNEAGIYTFAQLAATDAERISNIVKAQPWQQIDVQSWIAEASVLSKGGA